AQLFTNIKDAMKGARLLGGLHATYPRLAVMLGLPPETGYHDLIDFFGEAFQRRIKPVIVDSGACQQNVMVGEQLDLFKFPVPKLTPVDGGRYIGTMCNCVTKDPDSDWVNWGTYRSQVHDQRTCSVWINPYQHGGLILNKYASRGQKMEYVQFFGGDPVYSIVAGADIPYGVSEVEVAGGIRGEPVKLVKCKTVDLYVPADAEIVLEGTVDPAETRDEGPFAEYAGYATMEVLKRPIYHVSAVTYRDDPILPATCLGIPTTDELMQTLYAPPQVKERLRIQGLPDCKVAVWAQSGLSTIVVSTSGGVDKPRSMGAQEQNPHPIPGRAAYAGIPQRIASTVWSTHWGALYPFVIVVDDDVDPANTEQVLHALLTKCNPTRDIHIYPGYGNSPILPYLPKGPLWNSGYGGGNCLFDCTWPIEWDTADIPVRIAFDTTYPPEIREKVLANVNKWGLLGGHQS
ncbi:MAG: UbiD family decarboxylase, partial [Chloroflexi bacterium]|nr:UbiD family decarboxylase [Chloroflexota bacterium]